MQVEQVVVEFFSVKSLCERYNVQPITIRRWIAAGRFPQPLRIGRRKVLWPVALIQEFERRQMQAAGDTAPTEKVEA